MFPFLSHPSFLQQKKTSILLKCCTNEKSVIEQRNHKPKRLNGNVVRHDNFRLTNIFFCIKVCMLCVLYCVQFLSHFASLFRAFYINFVYTNSHITFIYWGEMVYKHLWILRDMYYNSICINLICYTISYS